MTVRSSNGLVHYVFAVTSLEVMSICGIFYAKGKVVPSQATTCLRCASNKRGHSLVREEAT